MKNTVLFLFLMSLAACSTLKSGASATGNFIKESPGPIAGTVGGLWMAQQLGYMRPEFLAAGLVAFSIYDPLAPTWEIHVTQLDAGYCRIDLTMKRLTTGGDGEARQTFLRAARTLMAKGGFADFDELHYEEGIDSARPFARRVASGEIRLLKSRHFPEM
ncbi:MAG: hypothetical protein LBG78_03475 [Azoarcus sp.]|jgi:hypothetical protein|nr:hypothetical protein [Azoarcus sp.]